jgi:hypothetical protein
MEYVKKNKLRLSERIPCWVWGVRLGNVPSLAKGEGGRKTGGRRAKYFQRTTLCPKERVI